MTAINSLLSVVSPPCAAETSIAATETEKSFEAIFENAHIASVRGQSVSISGEVRAQNAQAGHQAKLIEIPLPALADEFSPDSADKPDTTEAAQLQNLPTGNPMIAVSPLSQAAPVAPNIPETSDCPSVQPRVSAPGNIGAETVQAPSAPKVPAQPRTSSSGGSEAQLQQPTAKIIPDRPVGQPNLAQPDAPTQKQIERGIRGEPALRHDVGKPTAFALVEDRPRAKSEIIQVQKAEFAVERPAAPLAQHPDTLSVPTPAAAYAPAPTFIPAVAPSPTPTEPVLHFDVNQSDQWLDQLTREIVAVAGSDGGKLRFALTPEALGQLDVHIEHNANGVTVDLYPSTEAARQIIAVEQPRLTEELRQSGIRVNNNELAAGSGGQGTTQRDGTPSHQAPHRPAPHSLPHRGPTQPNPTRRQGRFA